MNLPSELLRRWLIPISSILALVFIVIGLIISTRAFVLNLLSGMAGIFLSIIVALLIVDKYVKQQRQLRWIKVRKLTYKAIASHLTDAIADMFIFFPVKDHRPMTSIIEGRNHPNLAAVTGMTILESQLKKLPNALSREKSSSDLAVEYYEAVRWDFNQLRDVLMPRVIESSDNQKLINALVEFDDARCKLQNAIVTHKRAVTHSVLSCLIILLEQAKTLYTAMYESWIIIS